jgi:ParB-like chromosome segregation protein Spo0J
MQTPLLMTAQTRRLDEVVVREDLYPRLTHNPALVQRYATILDVLPPIEVNQDNILIDGYHRLTAHRKAEAETIPVVITETASDLDILALAIIRNASHGYQLSEDDKRTQAIRLYAAGTGKTKEEIAGILSVTLRSVTEYLSDIDKQMRAERKQRIRDLWLAGETLECIARTITSLKETAIREEIDSFRAFESTSKSAETRFFAATATKANAPGGSDARGAV